MFNQNQFIMESQEANLFRSLEEDLDAGMILELSEESIEMLKTKRTAFVRVPETNYIIRNADAVIDSYSRQVDDENLKKSIMSLKEAEDDFKLKLIKSNSITIASGDTSNENVCKEVCRWVFDEIKREVCRPVNCKNVCEWIRQWDGTKWVKVKVCQEICDRACKWVVDKVKKEVCDLVCPEDPKSESA